MRTQRAPVLLCIALFAVFTPGVVLRPNLADGAPARIGSEAVVPENPRSHYSRYVNWRPADGEAARLNPPRMSWPYWPDWPNEWGDASHIFRLQISSKPDCSEPVVDVSCAFNFYNTLPALEGTEKWYWRVGYDVGTKRGKWSQTRSFTIARDVVIWDRSALAKPKLAEQGHPRILFGKVGMAEARRLAHSDSGSRAALDLMRRQADDILRRGWWRDFPKTDRGAEPKQEFYKIARDLVRVCFVWRMTGDGKYAGVKERAVTWASYPPGGRASPEGLGGDGNEDATQGNEFLALLFDWLYTDLTDDERRVMIESLEWRVSHIMNRFAWRRSSGAGKGPMVRLTFRSNAKPVAFEAESFELAGEARVVENGKASAGKLVELATSKAAITKSLRLEAGSYVIRVNGHGPASNQDAFYVAIDDGKPKRLFINGWGDVSTTVKLGAAGRHAIRILADPNEAGFMVDRLSITPHGDQRLHLRRSVKWCELTWRVPVPKLASSVAVELFNYYAPGEVWWDAIGVTKAPNGESLLKNSDFSQLAGDRPSAWRAYAYGTKGELEFHPQGGRGGTGAVAIICDDSSERGSWGQTVPVKGVDTLYVSGRYRTVGAGSVPPVRAHSLSGCCSSHQFESSMDTAVCGLALYEHSEIGREWFDLMLNYLIGVTNGFGFDEAWNEGAGYGTSKFKWLMNATMYFDTALPELNLGCNPYYRRIGDWFCRVIPVGMDHHAWGNQRNSSRGNHIATFRKLAYLTGEGRFLLNWQQYGGREISKWRPWIEYVLPAHYERPKPEPEKEFVQLFGTAGWAMAATGPPSLRSTYEKGAGLIFQCRPRGGYSHSFNSDGSFQLHAYGQMLNHGGGSSANKDAYAYHTMSHSTILVDGLGQAQPTRGMLCPTYGRIVGFERGKDYVYFAGDVTRCYPKQPGRYRRWSLPLGDVYEQRALPHLARYIRHILFVRGKYFVVYDDLACSKPATYTWLYHIRPEKPFTLHAPELAIDYGVGDVKVRLQHIAQVDKLKLDNRQGMDAFVNPFTGEDYRRWRKDDILCAHNLWISNAEPAREWRFLAVIYPAPPDEAIPPIERVDDVTVRVEGDVVCFDAKSPAASDAGYVVDVEAFRPK